MNINKTAKIAVLVGMMGVVPHAGRGQPLPPPDGGGCTNCPPPGPPSPVGPFLVDFTTDGNSISLSNVRVGSQPENVDLGQAWIVELYASSNAMTGPWQVVDLQTFPSVPVSGTLSDTNLGVAGFYKATINHCLNWKMAVGYHFRNGWNGFTPPFTNKYLVRSNRIEWLNVNGGVTNEVYGSPWTLVETQDPLTGNYTWTPGPPPDPSVSGWPFGGDANFPFTDATVQTNPNWTITDTHYRLVQDSGPGDPRYIHYTDVWLSSPNTMAMTDAATQGLVDRALGNADWGTLTMAWYGDCGPETCLDTAQDDSALADFYPAIAGSPTWPNPAYPPGTNYPYTPGMSNWVQYPWPVNNYTAAAGSFYVPCNWGGFPIVQDDSLYILYDQAEMYLKWGSVVRGPNGWTVNWKQFATSYAAPTVSGTSPHPGDCADTITINAPAAYDGTNWVLMAVPNPGP